MAQLKDSVVSGNLRVTDSTLTDTLQVTTIKAPTSSGTYGPGTSGQVLKSNGSSVYWTSDSNTDTKVTQSETTATNYRPIVFGATNSTDTSTLAATITDQVYVSTLLYAQPQNGILYANRMYLKDPGSKGQLNLLTSKYNVMLRNDDSNTYFLVTAQNEPTGTWTSARPLTINNSTGVCDINGNAATATTANKLNANAGATDRPVYFSGGVPVQCDTPWTSSWFKGVPLITTDGVMEIGKYIDFHKSNDSNADYDLRLQYTGTATGKTITLPGASGYVALLAKSGTSYYGMLDGDGTTSGWIRTTTNGLLPVQSGNAGSGHSSLGTSSWYFSAAYIDTIHGTLDGTASAWTTARTLTLGGQFTGSVSVKGNANMTLNGYMERAFIYDNDAVSEGHTWAEYAWHKFAEVTIAAIWTDCVITFLVSRTFGNSAENTGILSAKLRTNGSKAYDTAQLKWLVRNSGLSKDDFVMVYTSTSGTSTKAELWCRLPGQYSGLIFTVLKEHKRQYSTDTSWTLVKTPDESGSTHGSSSYPTTGITDKIISSDGTITNSTTGNATSADALNLTHTNELNFSKLGGNGHVWFGYRWNTQGTETSGGATITKYKFGNADGAGGLAGLEANSLILPGGSGSATLQAKSQTTDGTYLLPACGNGSYTLSIGMTQVGGVGNSLVISNVSGIPTGTLSFKIIFKSDAASPIYSMVEIPNMGDDIDCGGMIQVGDYTDGQQGSLRIVMKGVVVRVTAGTTAGTKTFTATVTPTTKINSSDVSNITRNVIMYKIYACS